MAEATFGDLLRSGSGHLDAAVRFPDSGMADGSVTAVARQARRIAAVMASYLDDVIPYNGYEIAARPGLEPWVRATAGTRDALRLAADNLEGAADAGSSGLRRTMAADPLAAHLAEAATCLVADRDLLHTHFVPGTDGMRSGHSDWSAVVTSAPVTRALLDEIAGWSRQLAILAGRLTTASAADPAIPVSAREGLASSRHWLLVADAAVKAGRRDHPVTALEVALLHAIPANALPERHAPGEAE